MISFRYVKAAAGAARRAAEAAKLSSQPAPVEPELPVAIVFPGQGSQSVGMAGKVLRIHPKARARYEQASALLDYDLLALTEQGPDALLGDTEHSQPAIYTASIAWYEALRASWAAAGRELRPVAMSGHSMGQISALVAAGALDFERGLVLVRERGRIMAHADRERPGGMASIIGLRDRIVRVIVGEACTEGTLVVANDNGPGHAVVSGDENALLKVLRIAEDVGAKRAVRLPISIASHSPLMESAQREFREVVASMPWRNPEVPVTSNIDASPLRTPDQIVRELGNALCAPVQWDQAVRAMSSDGARLFVEAGPGDVLSKLVRRIARKAWTFPLSDEEEGLASRDYPDTSGIPK